MHDWVGVDSEEDLESETSDEVIETETSLDSRLWEAIYELKSDVLILQWLTRHPSLTMSRQSIAFSMTKDDIVKMCRTEPTGGGKVRLSGFQMQSERLGDDEYMCKIWEQCVISRLATTYWSYGGTKPKYLQVGDSIVYDPDSITQTPDGHIWTQCVVINNAGVHMGPVWVFLGFRLKVAGDNHMDTVVLWASDDYTPRTFTPPPPRCRCVPCIIM